MPGLGPEPVEIGNGCWLLTELPEEVEDFWKQILGNLTARAISESTLVVLLAVPRRQGEYASSQPYKLRRTLGHLISLACFGRVPKAHNGHYCLGHSRKLEQFQEWPGYIPTPRAYFPIVRRDDFAFAVQRVKVVEDLMREQNKFYRVRMGLLAMDNLMRADYAASRLHLAVRALDGVLATRQGRGEKDFIQRAQYLIRESEENRTLLKTLYRLRSHVEHLKNPVDYVESQQPAIEDPLREAFRLSFQAELIASHAWHRFLHNEELIHRFDSDHGIQASWSDASDTLREAWGDPLDLESEALRRFHGREEELYAVDDQ
ncbi:MAG: hypothetical protein WCC53_08905 [Thermoanaerobaculia bacterium]